MGSIPAGNSIEAAMTVKRSVIAVFYYIENLFKICNIARVQTLFLNVLTIEKCWNYHRQIRHVEV